MIRHTFCRGGLKPGDSLAPPVSALAVAVLSGVEDLAVIVENGVVLVTRRDAPAAVRAAVEAIKAAGREELL